MHPGQEFKHLGATGLQDTTAVQSVETCVDQKHLLRTRQDGDSCRRQVESAGFAAAQQPHEVLGNVEGSEPAWQELAFQGVG